MPQELSYLQTKKQTYNYFHIFRSIQLILIEGWEEEGFKIIWLLDLNEDILSKQFSKLF